MIQKQIPPAKIALRAMIVVILLLLLVSFIYPLFWMIISALKQTPRYLRHRTNSRKFRSGRIL